MLRRPVSVRSDISEERSASILTVTRIGVLETMLAVTNIRRTLHSRVALVRNFPEEGILYNHRENLKSYVALTGRTL
jgi:hypothetical protein